jgi:large subunit ribosomal protein L30
MGIKLKLIKSSSSASERQLATIRGLGLKKLGSVRLLKDSPQVRGMLDKVRHLVAFETVAEEPKVLPRRKPKKIRVRDAARARAQAAK